MSNFKFWFGANAGLLVGQLLSWGGPSPRGAVLVTATVTALWVIAAIVEARA